MTSKDWITLDAAAARLGVSTATVRRRLRRLAPADVRHVRHGEHPGVGTKGAIMVRAEALDTPPLPPRTGAQGCNLQTARPQDAACSKRAADRWQWTEITRLRAGDGRIVVSVADSGFVSLARYVERDDGAWGPAYSPVRRVVFDRLTAGTLADALRASVETADAGDPVTVEPGNEPDTVATVRWRAVRGVRVSTWQGGRGRKIPMVSLTEIRATQVRRAGAFARPVSVVTFPPAAAIALAGILDQLTGEVEP